MCVLITFLYTGKDKDRITNRRRLGESKVGSTQIACKQARLPHAHSAETTNVYSVTRNAAPLLLTFSYNFYFFLSFLINVTIDKDCARNIHQTKTMVRLEKGQSTS